jgi:hypothetical protein
MRPVASEANQPPTAASPIAPPTPDEMMNAGIARKTRNKVTQRD